ncbi:unnamed protein product [Merluccius merluccius]
MSGITAESVRGVGSLFRDLDADDEESQTTQMESMCMNCHENGTTRLLLSRIPFFREVILSSFHCDHCHWSDTEVQSAGRIQDQGVRYSVRVASRRDLDREVVRSDSAAVRIPELDFEVPAFTQKGSLSTVEGLLDRAVAALEQDQAARRDACPDVAARIDQFVARLRRLKAARDPFTLVVEDVSGNSFVENPAAPQRDDAMTVTHFTRTAEQDALLGIFPPEPETADREEEGGGAGGRGPGEPAVHAGRGAGLPHQLPRVQRAGVHAHEAGADPALQGGGHHGDQLRRVRPTAPTR